MPRRVTLLVVLVWISAAGVWAQTPAPPAVVQRPAAPDAPGATPLDPVVDRILTRLEQRDVRDLRAELSWRIHHIVDEPDEALTKLGRLWFQRGQPSSRFLIEFSDKVSAGRKTKLNEKHLFDGVWYTEFLPESKQIVHRQVRYEDEPSDPFSIAQGVFPLPFGQPKSEILAEFTVQRLSAPDPDDLPDCDHLELTPRPGGRMDRLYKRVHIWVARGGPAADLPMQVRAGRRDGSGQLDANITIRFRDPQVNPAFGSSVFKIDPQPGFQETREPLPPRAAP